MKTNQQCFIVIETTQAGGIHSLVKVFFIEEQAKTYLLAHQALYATPLDILTAPYVPAPRTRKKAVKKEVQPADNPVGQQKSWKV